MGRINTSPRYVIDINQTGFALFRGVGRGAGEGGIIR